MISNQRGSSDKGEIFVTRNKDVQLSHIREQNSNKSPGPISTSSDGTRGLFFFVPFWQKQLKRKDEWTVVESIYLIKYVKRRKQYGEDLI